MMKKLCRLLALFGVLLITVGCNKISVFDSSNSNISEQSGDSTSQKIEEKPNAYNFKYKIFNEAPEIRVTTGINGQPKTVPNQWNKETYVDCLITTNCIDSKYEITDVAAGIRRRGNYTNANYAKKPLKIKFEEKTNLFGLHNGSKYKKWVLLADFKDLSKLRNASAFYMGHTILGSDGFYTSDFTPIELYIDDAYYGEYLLCEQQEVKKGRTSVATTEEDYTGTDIGYFFEYDGLYAENEFNFQLSHNGRNQGYAIKNDIYSQQQVNWIKNRVQNIYDIIRLGVNSKQYFELDEDNNRFRLDEDPEDLYEYYSQFISVESFVDTYIINEICADGDLSWSSFFLSYDNSPNGKHQLILEAPWDFDSGVGFKNLPIGGREINNFFAKSSGMPWVTCFNDQPWFVNLIRKKWQEIVDHDVFENLYEMLEDYTYTYEDMYERDYDRWSDIFFNDNLSYGETVSTARNIRTQGEMVDYVIAWLKARTAWMDSVYGEGSIPPEDNPINTTKDFTTSDEVKTFKKDKTGFVFETSFADLTGANSDSRKSGHNASGNDYIGSISRGMTATWYIYADIDGKALLNLGICRYSTDIKLGNHYRFRVNGKDASIEDVNVLMSTNGDQWHDWANFDCCFVDLEEGENIIELISLVDSAVNIDFLKIYFDGTLEL